MKENLGFNIYENGDHYFGQWNKDKKEEGYGIYFYKEEENNSEQLYIGEFKNNVKSREGIYFKISKFDEEKTENNLIPPLRFHFIYWKFYRI